MKDPKAKFGYWKVKDPKAKFVGLCFALGIVLFDWFAWSGLINSSLYQVGSVLAFAILAIISIPVTIVGGAIVIALWT